MAEDLVLMRCLRDSNMPKFVFEDVPLFGGLINDLFPGMDCPRVGYEDLKVAALADLEAKGFKCSNEKVLGEQVRGKEKLIRFIYLDLFALFVFSTIDFDPLWLYLLLIIFPSFLFCYLFLTYF